MPELPNDSRPDETEEDLVDIVTEEAYESETEMARRSTKSFLIPEGMALSIEFARVKRLLPGTFGASGLNTGRVECPSKSSMRPNSFSARAAGDRLSSKGSGTRGVAKVDLKLRGGTPELPLLP